MTLKEQNLIIKLYHNNKSEFGIARTASKPLSTINSIIKLFDDKHFYQQPVKNCLETS